MIIRWPHGWIISEQVAVGQAWQAFNSSGGLVDTKLDQSLDQWVQSLVTTTQQLQQQSVEA